MPDFVINPEQVAAELQWPKHDPACWVFNTPTGPRRFLINPDPGTVAGIVERLSGLDDDDSPVAAAKARMSGWRDQMAEIVAADVADTYQPDDTSLAGGKPRIENRAQFRTYVDGITDNEMPVMMMNAYMTFASEAVTKLQEDATKKLSRHGRAAPMPLR